LTLASLSLLMMSSSQGLQSCQSGTNTFCRWKVAWSLSQEVGSYVLIPEAMPPLRAPCPVTTDGPERCTTGHCKHEGQDAQAQLLHRCPFHFFFWRLPTSAMNLVGLVWGYNTKVSIINLSIISNEFLNS
jgi:hypothetical protein